VVNIGKYEQVQLFLSDFNEIWIFSTDFRKKFKCSSSWKRIVPCERTDRHDKVNSRFSQFC